MGLKKQEQLPEWEQQVKDYGWDIEELYKDLSKVWTQAVTKVGFRFFSDRQKVLLCLILLNNNPKDIESKSHYEPKYTKSAVSSGLTPALTMLYQKKIQNPKIKGSKVTWGYIPEACSEMGYLYSSTYQMKEFINYIKEETIILDKIILKNGDTYEIKGTIKSNEDVIEVLKFLFKNIEFK